MIKRSAKLLIILSLVVAGFLLLPKLISYQTDQTKNKINTAQIQAEAKEQDIYSKNSPIIDAVSKVTPAVVNIDTKVYKKVNPFGEDYNNVFKHFFGDRYKNFEDQEQVVSGLGSGVIISSDGYILTNEHVIQGAKEITVSLSDKRSFRADIAGSDSLLDLAILKIKAKDLPYAELGDSDALKVGEWVIAIGNPYGIGKTVTVGVLSAKGKEISDESKYYENLLQTDAAINRGNSGGPLVDIEGKVIGINTAIIPFAQGVGFAIPSNIIKNVKQQLIDEHKIRRSYLGITMQTVDREIANYFRLQEPEGILVVQVIQGGSAEGILQRGDIILEINGQRVNDIRKLRSIIQSNKPGTSVSILLIRQGKIINRKIVLKEMPVNYNN